MKYQPITCVWEVTMGCNMRCGHCGSSCAEALPDELNTEEALDVCGQIARLGVKWVTLSGGEPLTRKDLPQLVKELSDQGVAVNIITNGWLMNQDMANALKTNGIATVAISIDGTEEIHDSIRKPGAFAHARQAFGILKELGITTGAVTTITKRSLSILGELKEDLIRMGVDSWQVQIGLPMGNLKEKPDWLIEPSQVEDIIDFCYKTAREGRIKIYPADCIGYYTRKEFQVKCISYSSAQAPLWDGCNAGIRGFGVLHNGNILGCTSIRDEKYIEGSLRERSLQDIWEDEHSFSWRRDMKKEMLSGRCKTCTYGSKCLGGCPNTRLTMNGDIHSENQYCAYNLEIKRLESKYSEETDAEGLFKMAQDMIQAEKYQEAAAVLHQVCALQKENAEAFKAKGYCEYMCGNYELCEADNQKALELIPDDPYALSGYGIALHRRGRKDEGIGYVRKAVELTGGTVPDFVQDLIVMEQMG